MSLERLQKDIEELAQIGKNPEGQGVTRPAFSPEDMAGRRWLLSRIEEAGFKGSMDGAGNVFGLDDRPGTSSSFLMGSHLDSVPRGGVLDGTLGVLTALECMRVIRENGFELKENLELVATSDEEGRFGGMLGSQAICGELDEEYIETAVDMDGHALKDCMREAGLDPEGVLSAKRDSKSLSGFLELHIEQGPVLDRKGLEVGIIENVSGVFKWKIRLLGESNHSGTTPMDMRRDSFQALCEFSNQLPRILEEHATPAARATIGQVDLFPGNPHVIPGKTEFTFVGREFSDDLMEGLESALLRMLDAVTKRRGVTYELERVSRLDPTACDPTVVEALESEAKRLGQGYLRLNSGAGHDAQIFGKYMPMGMIFVPSLNGVSHSPEEWTAPEHMEAGANLFLQTLLNLCTR